MPTLTEAQREVLHALAKVQNASIVFSHDKMRWQWQTPYRGRYGYVSKRVVDGLERRRFIYRCNNFCATEWHGGTIYEPQRRITPAGREALSDAN
jgi:hypothetical protein